MTNNYLDNQQRLSFISFKTSKFFISKDVANIEPGENSCSNKKQISPYVLSVSPIDGIKPTRDLFTVIFEELSVII